jgi:hypothetical protein
VEEDEEDEEGGAVWEYVVRMWDFTFQGLSFRGLDRWMDRPGLGSIRLVLLFLPICHFDLRPFALLFSY